MSESEQFDMLANRLSANAAGVSAIRRLRGNPDYEAIVSMGEAAVPPLLKRLESAGSRPLWLSLLSDITGEQALMGKQTIDEGAESWLRWGRLAGYLPRQG